MKPEELLSVLHTANRLKDTTRHCWTPGNRHESVADHSWRLALAAFAVVPLIALITVLVRGRLRRNFVLLKSLTGRINGFFAENMSGMRLVQIFRKEKEKHDEFSALNTAYYHSARTQVRMNSLMRPLVEVVNQLGIAILIWYGCKQIGLGTLEIGVLYAFTNYIKQFFDPINDLAEKYTTISSAVVSTDRIFELLDDDAQLEDTVSGQDVPKVCGRVEFRHVWFAYTGENWVLKDVSFTVDEGEYVAIMGESGSGKTTLLNILAALDRPTSGTVLLDGKDVTALPPERRPVNTVFQSYALFPHMNVEKNVAYGLRVRRMDKASIEKRVREMLELVQMADFAKRMPSQLSGGQRQRIAIARALAPEPELLLLDEPLGALDLKLRRQMQLELKRLQKKLGITFVYITHDQEEAINMSDRIAVMRGGRFEQLGTPEEIYDEPKTHYVAQFIGRSTILSGKVESVGKDTAVIRGACGSFTADASRGRLCAGEACEICVRTERMRVSPVPVEGFQLPVTVREARYAGGSVLTYAILPDGEEAVATSEGRLSDALTPGSTAYLYWNPAQAAVIGGTSHGA